MGRIIRVKTVWSGFSGAPGYTNLYFEPSAEGDPIGQPVVDNAVSKVATFFAAWRAWMPPVVFTAIDATVEELDEFTGQLQGFWTATPPAGALGTGSATFSSAAGACVSWGTQGVVNGRRVRGRTFMVPLTGSAYDTDGTIHPTHLPNMRAAANALHNDAGGARLVVWHRPNALTSTLGAAYDVVTAAVNDKTAVLTSRRD